MDREEHGHTETEGSERGKERKKMKERQRLNCEKEAATRQEEEFRCLIFT